MGTTDPEARGQIALARVRGALSRNTRVDTDIPRLSAPNHGSWLAAYAVGAAVMERGGLTIKPRLGPPWGAKSRTASP